MLPLTDLLPSYQYSRIEALKSLDDLEECLVLGIDDDSRKIKPGYIFAAINGNDANGEDYIDSAIKAGAIAVMLSKDSKKEIKAQTIVIYVDDVRVALSQYAAKIYNRKPSYMAAVTGTDGKTSTAEFLRQLWEISGFKAASIGTLGLTCAHIDDELEDLHNTTPGSAVIHRLLSKLAQREINHVIMEASSHGLDQHRLDAVNINSAAFTTFSADHGDYHPSQEHYFNAKRSLFDRLLNEDGLAIFNGDDKQISALKSELTHKGIKVDLFGENGSEYKVEYVKPIAGGLDVAISAKGNKWQGVIPLYGKFQLCNILAALAMAHNSGIDIATLLNALPKLNGVRGRMEMVCRHKNGAPVFIDYAHTENALKNILTSLREHAENRLIVVFGCGGNRDRKKRPLMGQVAAKHADIVIITDDNPRNEPAGEIRQEIIAQVPDAIEIADRRKAIGHGIEMMEQGDLLVIAGKGHEAEQIIGNKKLHHHDGEIAKEIIAEISAKNGKVA